MKKKRNFLNLFLTGMVLLSFKAVTAQETMYLPVDSLGNITSLIQSDVDKLKKLKFTGYFQGQFQYIDLAGMKSFEGGNFPAASDKRFSVRRGRLKVQYDNVFSQYVVQIDVTEKGVSFKDAYALFTDNWSHSIAIKTGVFDRPFGHEISYSSHLRESPERARWEQTLFPGERDLGSMITFNPPKTSRFNWIKVNAGLFCGNGINPEFDSQKDFIGQISLSKSAWEERIKWGIGASYYEGGVYQGTKYLYSLKPLSDGSEGFKVDSADANKDRQALRQYYGADAQFSIDLPSGMTTLRAEYIFGSQPAGASSSSSISSGTAPTTDTYIRPFDGFNAYFIQNIAHTKHDIVVKYDWYDPNTKVEGLAVKSTYKDGENTKSTKLSAADMKYTTWGFGYVYHMDEHVKLTAYYALVKNESTTLKGYEKDLKDNVLTLRVQYKF